MCSIAKGKDTQQWRGGKGEQHAGKAEDKGYFPGHGDDLCLVGFGRYIAYGALTQIELRSI